MGHKHEMFMATNAEARGALGAKPAAPLAREPFLQKPKLPDTASQLTWMYRIQLYS